MSRGPLSTRHSCADLSQASRPLGSFPNYQLETLSGQLKKRQLGLGPPQISHRLEGGGPITGGVSRALRPEAPLSLLAVGLLAGAVPGGSVAPGPH